ncbi:MAG: O-antigen ligase family protein [Blastocatellia bacterium]|nr:O-antigen ligase family protein [Blastocatellia bacterium]
MAFAVAVFAGFGLAHLLLQADWRTMVVAIVFAGAGAVGLLILRNWRFGILSFFAWIVVEDLIRKYLGNRIVLYGAKDALIVLTYASFLFARVMNRRTGEFQNPIRTPLVALVALAVAECFNPQIEHPLIPIIGMRMHFLYIPLLYLGYAYFDSEERLRRFLLFALVLGGIVAMLGVLQALIGLDFLNPEGFVPGLRLALIRIAPESQMFIPRPTSVFVDAGRFAQYLFILFFLGLGALSYWQSLQRDERRALREEPTRKIRALMRSVLSARRRQERILWLAFALIGAGLIVSAQRAALLLVGVALLLLAVRVGRDQLTAWIARFRKPSFPIGKISGGIVLALVGLALIHPEHLIALYRFCAETLSPMARETEVTWRPGVYWRDILFALQESRIFGHGTGTASLGLQYLYGLDYFYHGETGSIYRVEGGYASVIWEWGWVGIAFWLWWTTVLVFTAARTARRLEGSRFFGLAIALVLFLGLLHFPYFFLGLPVYQNYVNNAYHWFLCGLLFRLPKLAAEAAPDAPTE